MPNNQKINSEVKYSLYIEHGKQYTDILKLYIRNLRLSNILKIIFKISFFIIIILIMLGLSIFFGYSTYKSFEIIKNIDTLQDNITESIIGILGILIPLFTTTLVSIIKLPEIIAKYLFNRKEEEHMAKIIENIQNYDVQIYSIEQDAKALVKKQQEGKNPGEYPNRDLPGNVQFPSDDTGEDGDAANTTGN